MFNATLNPATANAAMNASTTAVGVWNLSVPMQMSGRARSCTNSSGSGREGKLWVSRSKTVPDSCNDSEILDVPFAYSSNGDAFLEHDRTVATGTVTREIPLDQLPSPAELWARYCAAKGYNSRQTVVATQDYYDDGTRKSPRYYPLCPEVKPLTDAVTMIDNDSNGCFFS